MKQTFEGDTSRFLLYSSIWKYITQWNLSKETEVIKIKGTPKTKECQK